MRGRGPPGEIEVPQGSIAGEGSLLVCKWPPFCFIICRMALSPNIVTSGGVKALTY